MSVTETVLLRVWSTRRDQDDVVVGRAVTVRRWTLSWAPSKPTRWARRAGGQRTPGPWWEVAVPRVGSFVLGHDRSLFGFPENNAER